MIDPKELRIGNLVQDPQGRQAIVLSIHHDGIVDVGMGDYTSVLVGDVIQPIPLTEKWLDKLGFVSNPYQDTYEKGPVIINCNKTRGKLELWWSWSRSFLVLQTVHQVQNLWFALTGGDPVIHE